MITGDTQKGGQMFVNAWNDFGNKVSNSWKIDMGMFKTDPNKSFGGKAWEVISRFTWQAPQTFIGKNVAHLTNNIKDVGDIHYVDGATVLEDCWDGGSFSLGPYIQLGTYTSLYESYRNPRTGAIETVFSNTFMHEYGHYIQSQKVGVYYFTKYAIPSKLTNNYGKAELDANQRAYDYFSLYHADKMKVYVDKIIWDPSSRSYSYTYKDWNNNRYPREFNKFNYFDLIPISFLWNL